MMRLVLHFFELLACVTGVIYWQRIRHGIWKWFPFYLAVIFITEITLLYIGYVLELSAINIKGNNYFLIPLEFLFFFLLFYLWFETGKAKTWMLSGIILYGVSLFIDIIFLGESKFWFYSFSYTTGNIILLIAEFLFFYKFINSREILKYRSSMMFWISTGLLIFYLGSLPFYGLWNTLVVKYPILFNNYWMVIMCMNCTMYLFFCFAFIWGKPK